MGKTSGLKEWVKRMNTEISPNQWHIFERKKKINENHRKSKDSEKTRQQST